MPIIRSILLVLPALLLAGCIDDKILPADLSEHDYRIAHPITAEVKGAVAVFDRPAEGEALSAYDRDRLTRLGGEASRRGAGPVEVVAGAKAGEEAQALAFGALLAERIKAGGADVVNVRVASGAGTPGDSVATVRVPVWDAVVPDCGTWDRGLNPDPANAPHSNWGCAVQRNKAMMLQNPADLVRAREPSGRDANRAADVLDKYGKGQATGSAQEQVKQGTTSTVGASSSK